MGLPDTTGRIATRAYKTASHPVSVLATIATMMVTMVSGSMWGMHKIEAAEQKADSATNAVSKMDGKLDMLIQMQMAQMAAQKIAIPVATAPYVTIHPVAVDHSAITTRHYKRRWPTDSTHFYSDSTGEYWMVPVDSL